MTLKRSRIATFCIAVAGILGFSLLSTPLVAAAPAAHADPLVVVARDATAQSHCHMAVTIRSLRSRSKTISGPCASGTIVETVHVQLSEANARHETYVVLPATSASASVKAQAYQQIQQLLSTVQHSLLDSSMGGIVPNISCGQGTTITAQWTVVDRYGYVDGPLQGFVNYSRPSSRCSSIVIGQTGITNWDNSFTWYWAREKYASTTWQLYCRTIPTSGTSPNYTTYTGPNSMATQNPGYGFVMETADGAAGGGCNDPFAVYADAQLGVLN